jgi:hypothetical protein
MSATCSTVVGVSERDLRRGRASPPRGPGRAYSAVLSSRTALADAQRLCQQDIAEGSSSMPLACFGTST